MKMFDEDVRALRRSSRDARNTIALCYLFGGWNL